MTADVKNFYLCTKMDRHEFMRMPIDLIPLEFAHAYGLYEKVQIPVGLGQLAFS